ncbi:MAG: trehalose-phosphatase [Elusimicrobiota bacterium]
MKYLFDHWDKLKRGINSKYMFLFFDYDGTLTPIVRKPELAKLDKKVQKFLKKLSGKFKIAIISGRPLWEVKKFVGLKNIIYSGNHGFEIEFDRQKFIHPEVQKIVPEIQKIKQVISAKIKNIKGAFLEDKGIVISIHWRLVDKKYLPKLFVLVREIIRDNMRIRLTKGKKVWEIRPNVDWDKGKAVRFILTLFPTPYSLFPVFIGDDTTDEDAFKISKNGITIRVGKSNKSNARYYLKSQSEVIKFLKTLN